MLDCDDDDLRREAADERREKARRQSHADCFYAPGEGLDDADEQAGE